MTSAVRHAIDPAMCAWTRRELLRFPEPANVDGCNLPIFLHHGDAESLLFSTENGYVLDYCVDRIYEASDHCLIWIRYEGPATFPGVQHPMVYMYGSVLPGSEGALHETSDLSSPPSQILVYADLFSSCAGNDGDHAGWARVPRFGEIEEVASQYVSTGPMIDDAAITAVGVSKAPEGDCFHLDPGIGRMILQRELSTGASAGARVHLRAHFYDTMRTSSAKATHWIGLTTRVGSGAVGLDSSRPSNHGVYVFASGGLADGAPRPGDAGPSWIRTSVNRSIGWHLFELVWEDETLAVIIDGEPISTVRAQVCIPDEGPPEVAWLVAKSGGTGSWAGLELIRTRPGQNSWDASSAATHKVNPGDRNPWEKMREDRGHWQLFLEGAGRVVWGEVEQPALQQPVPVPEEVEVPPPPSVALTLECWSLPVAETDAGRMERVVQFFLEQLVADGVIIPENFQRVAQCKESQHTNCHVYRFGTRRLHLNVRETQGGRLCLVVRTGGGFLDFAEFVRRHGNLEQVKLQKQRDPQSGRQVVQLTSVLSQRCRRVTPDRRSGARSPNRCMVRSPNIVKAQ